MIDDGEQYDFVDDEAEFLCMAGNMAEAIVDGKKQAEEISECSGYFVC